MKNLFLTSFLALTLMSFESIEVDLIDCADFASVATAVQEDEEGCMTAADYNFAWTLWYNRCKDLNIE